MTVLFSWSVRATPTLNFIPDGNIAGFPGQTIGWAGQFQNDDPNDWIGITFSEFCGPGVTSANVFAVDCSNGQPGPYVPYDGTTQFGTSLGIYTDYLGPDSIFLAPFESGPDTFIGFPFIPGNPGSGIAQYAILPTASPGVDSGTIFVFYNLYIGDPRAGGVPDTANDPGNLLFSAGVNVTVLPVPEPATFLLVGGALLGIAGVRRRIRSKRP